MEENKTFIAYEYMEKVVRNEKVQLLMEVVDNFGWEIVSKKKGLFKTKLRLKRNIKLKNNRQLKELEKQMELAFDEIERLETTYKDNATLLAIVMGVLGSAFMAGAYFNFEASSYLWMVLLAGPGFILWLTSYPVYKVFVKGKKEKSDQLINRYYGMIYETSEKAFAIEKQNL